MFKQETKLSVKKYDIGLKACTILLSRLPKNVKVACRLFLHQFLVSKKICPQKYISIHNFKRNYNKFTKFQALFYKKNIFRTKRLAAAKAQVAELVMWWLVVSGGATRYFVVVALSSSVSIHTYTLQLISGTILATNMAATSFSI